MCCRRPSQLRPAEQPLSERHRRPSRGRGDTAACKRPLSLGCAPHTDGAVLQACVALAKPHNTSIAINFSPWYCAYSRDEALSDPTDDSPKAKEEEAAEIALWKTNLGKIKLWLEKRVAVSAVLVDSERFECAPSPTGEQGRLLVSDFSRWAALLKPMPASQRQVPASQRQVAGHAAAPTRRCSLQSMTSTTRSTTSQRPSSLTHQSSSSGGASRPFTAPAPAVLSPRPGSPCASAVSRHDIVGAHLVCILPIWVAFFIPAAISLSTGDSFGVSLYNIAELGYVREEFKRTVAVAKEHGVNAVTPYVSLGAGDLNSFKGRVGFVDSLEYPLLNS